MRSKAPLALMELAVMLAVFALAAALCLRAFVWADSRSAESARQDQALVQVQSAAEVLKHHHGDFQRAAEVWGGSWDGTAWTAPFDHQWQPSAGEAAYLLRAVPVNSGLPYLGRARVEVFHQTVLLADLEIAWQEGSHEER